VTRRSSAITLVAFAFSACFAVLASAADDWWNPAWPHRTRVRVRLAPSEPLGFRYRPPAAGPDQVVTAVARIPCPVKLAAPAQQDVRVVDAGGNVLPCTAEGPDEHGMLTVAFPARRIVTGQLATGIQDGTSSVALNIGADKAVRPGMRFYALAGARRIAALQVDSVEAKRSVATVLDKSTPTVAKGIPVESDVLTDAVYDVYYGNPKPKDTPPRWTPKTPTVALYGWRITDGAFINELSEARGTYRRVDIAQVRAAMRRSPAYAGSAALTQIANRANPLDYEGYHLSFYESFFYCDVAGLWRFSVDSAAPSYLFIDGTLMAQRPGFFYQVAGNFEHRGKIKLQPGYHHLLMCAVESSKQNTRLGWQAPTATVFSLVPPSFFRNRVAAELVGYQTHAQRHQVFFTYELAARSVAAPDGSRYQCVRFVNLTPPPDGAAMSYAWDFGDGSQQRAASPWHIYRVPADGSPATFAVVLRAQRNGRPYGQCRQTIRFAPRPPEELNLSLDIVSFSNIVYYDERTSIALRLRNTAFAPVIVRATGRLEAAGRRYVVASQDLMVEAQNENFFVVPVDMKELADKTALIELDVHLGRLRVLDAAVRIVPFPNLTRKGKVAVRGGRLVLGPGGPYTGVAWTGEPPRTDYELTIAARASGGHDFCNVTFPVGKAFCTLRPRAWGIALAPDSLHKLRLRVAAGRVQAWLDDKLVTDVPRSKAQTALPLAFDAMKPLGVHASLGTRLAISSIELTRLGPKGAPAPPPAGPGKKAPAAKAPPAAKTALFDGSLRGWRAAAKTDLALIQRGLAGLYDYAGRRVMLATEIEDADRHMRWVFVRAFHNRFLASRRRVLVFGDRMANRAKGGKQPADYVAMLQQRLAAANRPLQFIERTSGLLPTVADVILFARTLRLLKPLPDIIVISPGLSDVQQAVGERDFARSLDLMIDAVRAADESIKIIFVSPPPCPRNIRVSRLYTRAAERVARRHHIGFLDLEKVLTDGRHDWMAAIYAAPDAEGIFLDQPNMDAHKRIADAIEKLLR